jgi:hypothetical protein
MAKNERAKARVTRYAAKIAAGTKRRAELGATKVRRVA